MKKSIWGSMFGVLLLLFVTWAGCTGTKGRKVVVLGFEGLTGAVLSQMIDNGSLPNFELIDGDGSNGDAGLPEDSLATLC